MWAVAPKEKNIIIIIIIIIIILPCFDGFVA
jgi:hypothetical protein